MTGFDEFSDVLTFKQYGLLQSVVIGTYMLATTAALGRMGRLMNILLVYPVYPDTFWSFKHVLPFVARKAAFPPLGLLTVASMLPDTWKKRLVDTNVKPLLDTDLEWADIVLISAMLVQADSAKELMVRAKTAGKKVVAGGPAFSSNREMFPEVDHFILGEAETILPVFLHDLNNDSARNVYEATERPDLAYTPTPMWRLINFKDYVSLSVQYSRGCPFDCEFCGIVAMNGRYPRVKSPEQMLGELQSLFESGWRGTLFIIDDNFIGNVAHVKKFLPKLASWQQERGYPFKLMTEASINLANDRSLMEMMSAANFHKVFIGIETPSTKSLQECGKIQNVTTDLANAVRTIHQYGIQVMGGFIVGFDHDTPSIFEEQSRFIQTTGVVTAMVGILNALPQTRLWRRLQAEGRLYGTVSGENTDVSLNFTPSMGRETLIQGYKRLLWNLYSPREYYNRIDTFLAFYIPKARGRFIPEELRALARSMWSIGLVSPARFHYWKLIFKTLLTKRKAFPVAVELAILGEHFKRVASRVLSTRSHTRMQTFSNGASRATG